MGTDLNTELRVRFERAIRLKDENDLGGALEVLLALAEDYPRTPAVFGMLGHIYRLLGRHRDASESFKKATKMSPDSELASLGLFHSLMELGDEQGGVVGNEALLGALQVA